MQDESEVLGGEVCLFMSTFSYYKYLLGQVKEGYSLHAHCEEIGQIIWT